MTPTQTRPARQALQRAQRGAALLIAMLILTLVATVAAAMVWHQQRAIEVEAAERASTQANVMLAAILDTARFFIRTLPPGTPIVNGTGISQALKDMRLDQLLAADRNNNADSPLEAFFSAQITDVQGRYNLRRLIGDDGKPVALELAALRRLCQAAGLQEQTADQLAAALGAALGEANTAQGDDSPLAPGRIEQLAWLGVDANTIAMLHPHVELLPGRTAVNVNNATVPSLMAAVDGLDMAAAQLILNRRPPTGWKDTSGLRALLPESVNIDDGRVSAQTRYFELRASVRLGDRERVEQWLLEWRSDRGNEVTALRHRPTSVIDAAR